jgi:LysM repeat protein/ABC-type branched-subunit amino acid transport system substrate-binding protein
MRLRFFTLLLLIFAFSFCQLIYAQDSDVRRSSVVEIYKGKPYYMHFVKRGETLASISDAYGITVDKLISENPSLDKGLKPDMVLRIPHNSVIYTPQSSGNKPIPSTQQSKPVEKPKEQPKPVEKPKEQPKPIDKQITPVKPVDKPTTQGKPIEKPIIQEKPADDPRYITYLVKKLDTFYGISKQYNVTVDEIEAANPGIQTIQEGMWIRIPKKKTEAKLSNDIPAAKPIKATDIPDEIVIKPGETLYALSKTYNVSYDELIDMNPKLKDGLKAGMVLKLPKTQIKTEAKPEVKPNASPEVIQQASQVSCYSSGNIDKTYKVALLLPFLLEESSAAIEATEQKKTSDFENFNYYQFYAGFMLAADSLQKYGLHARIQVLDGDKLNDTLAVKQALRKPGMDKQDLIIGPMYANSFSVAARFAKKHEIGIVNPLSKRENIVSGNPFVIKTQVSGSGIADKLSKYINTHYPNANIISVRNDSKELKSTVDEFEAGIKGSIADHSLKCTLQTSTYTTDMMAGVSKKLKSNAKNIVIFFSNNKLSVPNFVSLLNPFTKSNDIILMGMDGWEDFDMETEFLVNLNYHQLTSTYIDYNNEAVKQFVSNFRNKYGAVPVPAKFAFLGYDIGWYFLTSLMWYGNDYLTCIPDHEGNGLQYNFKFKAGEKGNGIQNQDITIVKLQDYKMVKVE